MIGGGLTSVNYQNVNFDISPNADNTYSLGTAAYSWKNLFVDTLITVAAATMTGNLDMSDNSIQNVDSIFGNSTNEPVRIGDAGDTGHSLTSEDDLHATGKLEVDGAAYFDGTIDTGGKLTAGANEIEGSAFDIDGGDISAVTISGGLTWSAAQDLGSQALTNVNIDSGTVDAITSLTVANNVDIGNYDIRALSGTFDGLTSGRVVFASTSGVLSDDSDFTFSTDTLTVTKIGAFQAAGAIDFDNQNMTNVDIDSGDITNVTISGGLTWSAAQDLGSQALTNVNFDGGTVDGATITDPGINGTATTTGLTMPAFAMSGELTVPDGADGDPSINFSSNTATGLYYVGPSSTGVEANLKVDASISIGPINPSGTQGFLQFWPSGGLKTTGNDNEYYDLQAYDVDGATFTSVMRVQNANEVEIGFFGATPAPQQTGVAVNAAGIHAALVNLGLITA
jgi:hypothetical protein